METLVNEKNTNKYPKMSHEIKLYHEKPLLESPIKSTT